jgi:predicted Kef-type K+ transport protein
MVERLAEVGVVLFLFTAGLGCSIADILRSGQFLQ